MVKFKKKIEAINARYNHEASLIVKQIKDEYILPYCLKHNVSFRTGMGTYTFFEKGTKHLHTPSKKIHDLLELKLYSYRIECFVGLEMEDIN